VIGYDQFEHASLTDVGVRRTHNQDAHAVVLAGTVEEWQEKGHIFIVSDGMGAHAVGEMASEMAAKGIPLAFHKHTAAGVAVALERAFQETNASIHERGQQNPEFKNMGTTSTALVLRPEGAWVAHVGDSRLYRVRNGRIEQLSYDHSLVWETARRQGIDPDEVEGVRTNVIVRSIGPEPQVQTDVEGPHPVRDGDLFILCSDGLSGQLSDHEIGAVASVLPPEEACRLLIDLANLRGGPDNITVIIVKIGKVGSGRALATPSPRDRKRFPWPLGILLLGVALAGVAVGLAALQRDEATVAFVLAVLTILGGIVGLGFYYRQEKQRTAEPSRRTRTRVYRHSSCQIEQPLLDKLQKAEAALVKQARDKHWQLDWAAHKRHHDQAAALVAKGDLPGAFRETCRAVRVLTEALAQRRQKEESFQPHWDRMKGQSVEEE
jgi:protein phosphatase